MNKINLKAYLQYLIDDDVFVEKHINYVYCLWLEIQHTFPDILLPVVILTNDHGIQMSWTYGSKRLSMDIYEDRWDWFFRDRISQQTASGSSFEKVLDVEFVEYLGMVIENTKCEDKEQDHIDPSMWEKLIEVLKRLKKDERQDDLEPYI